MVNPWCHFPGRERPFKILIWDFLWKVPPKPIFKSPYDKLYNLTKLIATRLKLYKLVLIWLYLVELRVILGFSVNNMNQSAKLLILISFTLLQYKIFSFKRQECLPEQHKTAMLQRPEAMSPRILTRPNRKRWPKPSYHCAIFILFFFNSIFKSVMRIRISFTSDNWKILY